MSESPKVKREVTPEKLSLFERLFYSGYLTEKLIFLICYGLFCGLLGAAYVKSNLRNSLQKARENTDRLVKDKKKKKKKKIIQEEENTEAQSEDGGSESQASDMEAD